MIPLDLSSPHRITFQINCDNNVKYGKTCIAFPIYKGNRFTNDEIKEKIRIIIIECFKVDSIQVDLDINLREDLGLDELDVVHLVMEVEKEFTIDVSDEDFERLIHFKDVVDLVAFKTGKGNLIEKKLENKDKTHLYVKATDVDRSLKDTLLPEDVLFSKDHIWVKVKERSVYIGLTNFAQKELGEMVYIDFNENLNRRIKTNKVFATVEAVKTVIDLVMPVSGTIIRVNSALEDKPELINESPYDLGWLIEIKIENLKELKNLLDADEYKKFIKK